MDKLIEFLTVFIGTLIPLTFLISAFLVLKIIDWFYQAKEYDDKKLIKKVIEEEKKNGK